MVMMGRSFESWFLQATDARALGPTRHAPFVTAGIKKIRAVGVLQAFGVLLEGVGHNFARDGRVKCGAAA